MVRTSRWSRGGRSCRIPVATSTSDRSSPRIPPRPRSGHEVAGHVEHQLGAAGCGNVGGAQAAGRAEGPPPPLGPGVAGGGGEGRAGRGGAGGAGWVALRLPVGLRATVTALARSSPSGKLRVELLVLGVGSGPR